MQGDKAKHQRLEILHQIVEDSQAFRVRRLGHVVDRAYLGSLRRVNNPEEHIRTRYDASFTSNEMWSFPTRISSSCLPSLFLVGHFASSSLLAYQHCPIRPAWTARPYFKISLSFTILLISSTTRELTNTIIDHACQSAVVLSLGDETAGRTLFPNQAVVSVVGVVGIAGGSAAAVANNAEVELFITQHD